MVMILVSTAKSMNNDNNLQLLTAAATGSVDDQQTKNVNLFSGTPYIEYLAECMHLYHVGSLQGYNI